MNAEQVVLGLASWTERALDGGEQFWEHMPVVGVGAVLVLIGLLAWEHFERYHDDPN